MNNSFSLDKKALLSLLSEEFPGLKHLEITGHTDSIVHLASIDHDFAITFDERYGRTHYVNGDFGVSGESLMNYLNKKMDLPFKIEACSIIDCNALLMETFTQLTEVLTPIGCMLVSTTPQEVHLGLLVNGRYLPVSDTKADREGVQSMLYTGVNDAVCSVNYAMPGQTPRISMNQKAIGMLDRGLLSCASGLYEARVHREVIAERMEQSGIPDPERYFPKELDAAVSVYELQLVQGIPEHQAIAAAFTKRPRLALFKLSKNKLEYLAAQTACGTLRQVFWNSHNGTIDDPLFSIEAEESLTGKDGDAFSECWTELRFCLSENDEDFPELKVVFTMTTNNSNRFDTVVNFTLEELLAGDTVTIRGSKIHILAI